MTLPPSHHKICEGSDAISAFYLFILAMLGLHCAEGFSLDAASRGYALVEVHRLLTVLASLVAGQGL